MKKLAKKLENLMSAIAFAEAGDEKTAREIMKESERTEKRDRIKPSQRPTQRLRT